MDTLSIEEQEFIINTVNKDIIGFFEEEKTPREEQIRYIERQILAASVNHPKTPNRDFFIDLLERHLARLKGTAAEKYIYKNTGSAKALPPQQTETKTDKLNAVLDKYGFFDLIIVKALSEPNKEKLVELLSLNELPYCIAMFHFLGYLKHLEKEHFTTKYKLNKEVAKWFNSDKEGRAVKGNISTLSEYSKENRKKYTAHTHKETVQKDYQNLK